MAGEGEGAPVVGRHGVGRARDLGAHARAAELLLRHVLAGRRLHERRAAGEHRGALAHDDVVGERRGEGTVAGGGAEHDADHRDVAREVGHREQIVRRATHAGIGLRQPVARAFEDHHEGEALLERELGDAEALGGAAGADRAAEHREVLGPGEDGPAVDPPDAADEALGGDVRDGADERADLAEAARVE